MTFLSSFILWFTLLGSIPVILHFLNRRPVKKINFPSIRFLKRATKKSIKKFKILYWLLLITRILIIVLLTFAFARPVWKGYGKDNENAQNIIMIDNSYSMEYLHGKESSLDISKRLASQLVREMEGEFSVGIFNKTLADFTGLSADQKKINKIISNIKPSYFTTDIKKSLNELFSVIEEDTAVKTTRNIIILSDFNRDILNSDVELKTPGNIRFLLIDVSEGKLNQWAEKSEIQDSYAGIPCEMTFTLKSNKNSENTVSLFVNDEKINQKEIDISDEKEIKFSHIFSVPGLNTGYVKINENIHDDRIRQDNINYFHVKVRPRIKVLLVDGSPGYTLTSGQSYFIAKALSPGNYQTPTIPRIINSVELLDHSIDNYDVVMLLNVELNQKTIKKILEFSSSGGGLCLFLGDNVNLSKYNYLLNSLMPVEIDEPEPKKLEKTFEISAREELKDIIQNSEKINIKKIYKTISSTKIEPELDAQGMPLLWLYAPDKIVRGRVGLFTTTVNMSWNDYPVKTSFPVLMQKITKYLAVQEQSKKKSIIVGEILPLDSENTETAEVIANQSIYKEKEIKNLLPKTVVPGNYISGNKCHSVNIDYQSKESSLKPLSSGEVKKTFVSDRTLYIPFSEHLRKDLVKAVTGEEKSHIFLIGAFILLISEELLRKYLQTNES
ncbi:MAG: BatA domain-containing protein [Elusimicrobiota bacterium]